jgi:transposase
MDMAHGVDSTRVRTFRDDFGQERNNSVRHHNSVFHDLLKRVPWALFERLVAEHGADRRVRRLSSKSQLVALLYGQLSGAASLREICGGLHSHAGRLYHLGASPVQRSTLADANARRPGAVFAALFAALAGQAHRGLRRALGEATYLIDSTGLPLPAGAEWARFSTGVCGAKLHVIYDPDAEQPVYAVLTAARINDITPAKAMPIEPGASYVFDLGYYDYGFWAKLHRAGCRIVTRLKANTRLTIVSERAVPAGGAIVSDRIGLLPARQARTRCNPFGDPVREVRVRLATGKLLRIVSNDLEAPAEQIAALYKRRWAIELFFRWVKQTLKIRHFLGTSQNAVRIQIAVALIAYLLLKLAQADQTAIPSPLAFARLVRANLMHRKRIDALAGPPKPTQQTPAQLAFTWSQS